MKRVTDQPGVEVAARRSRSGKVFQVAPDKFRVVVEATPLHWRDGAEWRDVDLEWTLVGGRYEVRSAAYLADFDPATYTLRYRSRTSGDMRVRLVTIDGVAPIQVVPQVSPSGERMRFFDIAPGVGLVVVARFNGPEIMRRFSGPALPEIVWEVSESEDRAAIVDNFANMTGWDNHDRSSVARATEVLARNISRLVEISQVTSNSSVVGGRRLYSVTEKLTGRTRWRDPITRVPEWRDEIAFPVLVDVQVVEDIVANGDDGWSYDAGLEYWKSPSVFFYEISMSTTQRPAWRFQTVNVPQGATIDSATLRVKVVSTGDMSAPLYGNDVDDAAFWADASTNGVNGMVKTTASVTFDGFTSAGNTTRTVTSIIQEIVIRAGWEENNDMRLGVTASTGSDVVTFRTFDYDPTGSGRLTIDYTAAGGAGHPTARRHGGIPGMSSTPRFGRSW